MRNETAPRSESSQNRVFSTASYRRSSFLFFPFLSLPCAALLPATAPSASLYARTVLRAAPGGRGGGGGSRGRRRTGGGVGGGGGARGGGGGGRGKEKEGGDFRRTTTRGGQAVRRRGPPGHYDAGGAADQAAQFSHLPGTTTDGSVPSAPTTETIADRHARLVMGSHFFSQKDLETPGHYDPSHDGKGKGGDDEKRRGVGDAAPSLEIFRRLTSAAGVERPSRIQVLAWPAVLAGGDVIVADQTGSGKTLAYLVPVLQRMHAAGTAGGAAGRPSVAILAPTTELAGQVGTVCKKLAGGSGLPFRTYVATGGGGTAAAAQNSEGGMSVSGALRELRKVRGSSGVDGKVERGGGGNAGGGRRRARTPGATGGVENSVAEQISHLRRNPVDVLVATPGRAAALLRAGALDLSGLRSLVLDEADALMADDTFADQLRVLGAEAPQSAQFAFVTATLPDSVAAAIKVEFPNVARITGPGLHKTSPNLRERLVDVSVPSDMNRDPKACVELKQEELLRSLRTTRCGRTLVFCNTVESCRAAENYLRRKDRKGNFFNVRAYHGALTGKKREENLSRFSSPDPRVDQVLVCTDRAARGVDFSGAHVDHVIVFDFPKDPAEYVRRVGRTARAGRPGTSTVFAYGWQLPIARKIMAQKLDLAQMTTSDAFDDRGGGGKPPADVVSGHIASGTLWRERGGAARPATTTAITTAPGETSVASVIIICGTV